MPTRWWEIQVDCDPWLEDSVFWRAEEVGCRGTASETTGEHRRIKAYIHQEQTEPAILDAFVRLLHQDALSLQLPQPQVQWHLIDEEDWADSWKQYWHPQEIGDRFLVYPAWLPLPVATDRLVLRLDPGVAFGTGGHATTQLCLEGLEWQFRQPTPNRVIADIGCGSGILAIGAILLGASQVYAVDIDPLAVQSTQHNRDLNQIDDQRLTVELGSLDQLISHLSVPVDGIVCNILAPVIIELMSDLGVIAQPKTWAILSGLLVSQAPAVIETAERHGWLVIHQVPKQDWACLTIVRL
jgi:ribosomal protein L11 methyltransferase